MNKKYIFNVMIVSIERAWKYGNLEADQMAGYLRNQGCEVTIRYFSTRDDVKLHYDLQKAYDLVAFYVTNANYRKIQKLVEEIKNSSDNTKIVFCGEYATRFYKELLTENPAVDYVVLGDGEVPIGKLINNLVDNPDSIESCSSVASHSDLTGKKAYINKSIDYLPAFDYCAQDTYARNARKLYGIQTKNDVCGGNCTFCIKRHGDMHYKPVSIIIEQIIKAHDLYGVKHIFFTDNNLFDPNDSAGKKHVVELCNELLKLKNKGYSLAYQCYIKAISLNDTEEDRNILALMKNVGFVEVFVGIESANDDDLLLFNKYSTVEDNYKILRMLKDAGLTPIIGFIGFHAHSTLKKIRNNFEFLVENECIFLSNYLFGFMDVHKYTKIYEILKSDGLIIGDDKYSYVEYEYSDKTVKTLLDYVKNELRPKLLELRYETDTITEMYREHQVLYPNDASFDDEIRTIREQDLSVIKKYLGILFRDFDIDRFKRVETEFWDHFASRQDDLRRICDALLKKYNSGEALSFYARRLRKTEDGYLEIQKQKCNDICAGYVSAIDQNLWFSYKERMLHIHETKILPIKEKKRIVIVLESPHKQEYAYESPMPALGITGINLQKLFGKVVNLLDLQDDEYEIILMNAVQYQCSLGVNTSLYRDHIWLNMWFNEQLKKNFSKRLLSYSPDIIINCCTIGNHVHEKISEKIRVKTVINAEYLNYCCSEYVEHPHMTTTLKDIVWEEIDTTCTCAKKYECAHPSSWRGDIIPLVYEH